VIELPQGTKEFLKVKVLSDEDMSTSVVKIGVNQIGDAVGWLAAVWIGSPVLGGDGRYSQYCRTSAAWDTMAVLSGYWHVSVRITDSPEDIIRPAGIMRVVL
jgi:hypothetical protein